MGIMQAAIGGDVVLIANRTVSSTVAAGSPTAGYRLDADGQTYTSQSEVSAGAYIDSGEDWVSPVGNAANYEVEAVVNSGTLSSGPSGSGTWTALSSDVTWTRNGPGTLASVNLTLSIRRVGTTTVLDTASITLEADGSP